MKPNVNISSYQTTKPATKAVMIKVCVFFNPDAYANGIIHLLDEDDNLVEKFGVNFTLDELNQWTTDDNYVLELGLQKLGISFG